MLLEPFLNENVIWLNQGFYQILPLGVQLPINTCLRVRFVMLDKLFHRALIFFDFHKQLPVIALFQEFLDQPGFLPPV